MQNILIIARKELLSTFRQRNLMLIMFLSPIVLVLIMGLAFGGFGGSGSSAFTDLPIAVVNQDAGFVLQEQLPANATRFSLNDLEVEIGGQMLNLGEQLEQNSKLDLQTVAAAPGDFSLNFGNQLAAILLSTQLTATGVVSGPGESFDLSTLICPLLPADEQGDNTFSGSLDELFDATALADPDAARAGVQRGDYVAAVIIPPDFSARLAPDFGLAAAVTLTGTGSVTGTVTGTVTGAAGGLAEVVGSGASPIGGSIVRAVVEGIVSQFDRVNVAMDAIVLTGLARVNALDLASVDSTLVNMGLITTTLQGMDGAVLAPLGCLLTPGAGNIQVNQQPLTEVQERSTFSILMVALGGPQAVFFALFTGVFGINAIYEDRRQGTLQRVLASPTSSSHVLFGRLLGNLVIVMCQLAILLSAFTLIATIVEGELTLIWGANVPMLFLVLLGLSLFTTGLGVMVVGLASSSEQVQLIGPIITLALGALGGVFGGLVPSSLARFSPTWWGLDALQKLAAQETGIGLNLIVLFSFGVVFALAGTHFFRRRMGL